MTGMDHPPSTTSSSRLARRALTTGVAALLAVATPVVLVTASSGGQGTPSASSTSSSVLADLRAQGASSVALARISSFARATPASAVPVPTTVAPTTTTTAPPPPPTTAAPAPPPPVQAAAAPTGGGYNDPSNPAAWDRLAQCESGGNWATNTGNGYYGGLQFSLGSWQSVGGPGYPHEASRETQIEMGQRLYHSGGGWSHWPGCSRALGYR